MQGRVRKQWKSTVHPSQQEEPDSCRSSIISQNTVLQGEAHFERSSEDVCGRKDI